MDFEYSARDALGKIHEGTIEAENQEEATQLLRRDGFHVLEIEEADDGLSLFPARVRRADIICVANQLAVMVDTGVNLADALDGICQQEQNPSLRQVLVDIKQRVESGEDFSSALARYPQHFDSTFVAMIQASEQTGTMGEMLERAAGNMEYQLETRRKVRAALAYPCVMMVIASLVTVFLLTFVMPKFAPLFESKNIDLPVTTEVMMAASESLRARWWAWLGGTALAITGLVLWSRTPQGRTAVDWIKINIPIIGPMLRRVAISRSIRTLATMLRGGVPLLDALEIAANVSGNFYFQRVWQNAIGEISQGKRIRDALAPSGLFPGTLLQMISCGEDTGNLDGVLDRASRHYDAEVDASLKVATRLLEPIMVTAMGAVVACIAYSLLLPVFELSSTPAG